MTWGEPECMSQYIVDWTVTLYLRRRSVNRCTLLDNFPKSYKWKKFFGGTSVTQTDASPGWRFLYYTSPGWEFRFRKLPWKGVLSSC